MDLKEGDIVKTIEFKVNTNKGCIGKVRTTRNFQIVELDWLYHNKCPYQQRCIYIFNVEDLKKVGKLTGLLYGVNYAKK